MAYFVMGVAGFVAGYLFAHLMLAARAAARDGGAGDGCDAEAAPYKMEGCGGNCKCGTIKEG